MKDKEEQEQIDTMLMHASERLRSAYVNQEHGLYNDSISRSYYAAFHAVNAVLYSKGYCFSKHAQVIGTFNKEFINKGIFTQECGKAFANLFDLRIDADYDYYRIYSKEESKAAIDNAELILNAVKNYFSSNEAG